jgi:hypothetical protein
LTEDDWLTCTDPALLRAFLGNGATDRKLRLFGCAAVRSVWECFPREPNPEEVRAVERTERYVDGKCSYAEQELFRNVAYMSDTVEMFIEIDARPEVVAQRWGATAAYRAAAFACRKEFDASVRDDAFCWAFRTEMAAQWRLLRNIFHPFRRVEVDPRWLTSNVVDLARTIYMERCFDRLPILADALMDAGCTDEEMLKHCRSEGPHVRGCWVVDLLIGMS